jgi:hypothetical protein
MCAFAEGSYSFDFNVVGNKGVQPSTRAAGMRPRGFLSFRGLTTSHGTPGQGDQVCRSRRAK